MTKIIAEGGDVQWHKNLKGEVEILWVQTKQMRDMTNSSKPKTFQLDTTFGTNAEGRKICIYCKLSTYLIMHNIR